MVEVCQNALHELAMLVEWLLGIVIPIFKGKGDFVNSSCFRDVKLLEEDIEMVVRMWVMSQLIGAL